MAIITERGSKVLISGKVTKFRLTKSKRTGEPCFFVTLQSIEFDPDMGVDMPCSVSISFFDSPEKGQYDAQFNATNAAKMIKKVGGVVIIRAVKSVRVMEDGTEELSYIGQQVSYANSIIRFRLSEDKNTGEIFRATAIYAGVATARTKEDNDAAAAGNGIEGESVGNTISVPLTLWNTNKKERETVWLQIRQVPNEKIQELTPDANDLNSMGNPRHKVIAVEFNEESNVITEENGSMYGEWKDVKNMVVLEKPDYSNAQTDSNSTK